MVMDCAACDPRDRLRDAWYALASSDQLAPSGPPLARTLFGTPLVLWRDQAGAPRAFFDRCLHRNAALSCGRFVAGQLICPYHGWGYDRSGALASIPSEPPGAAPTLKARLPDWPCIEHRGLVWVYPGSSSPSEDRALPDWPAPPTAAWRTYFMQTVIEAGVDEAIENFMDVPHTLYVHAGWFRKRAGRPVDIDVETTADTVTVTYHQEQDRIGFTDRIVNPRRRPTRHVDRFVMPSLVQVDYLFGSEHGLQLYSALSPRDERTTFALTQVRYRLGITDLISPLLLPWYTRHVLQQDLAVLRAQRDTLERFGGRAFASTAADLPQVRLRQLRDRRRRGEPPAPPQREQDRFWI